VVVLWRLALPIAVLSPLAVDAAETAAVAPAPEGAASSTPSLTYTVTVEAPSPLKETLLREVGLARWQGYSEMTDDLLARLAREAIEETRGFAAAEGFFSAAIDVKIDRKTTPVAVTLVVDPGVPTRIASVRITVTGPASADSPLGTETIARITKEWALPEGAQFKQEAWTLAKERAINTLTGSPYAAARIAKSEALIDPEHASADLTVELASGPAFGFGQFEITGLSKYPPSLVRNYSTIVPGTPYSDVVLNQYVRRLNASGYFASVQAKIDPETSHPENATVNIAVIEARPKRFEGGIGYSTDVQFRASASYRDVNFDGHGMQLLAEARLETRIQSGSLKFQLPPNESGWIATYGGGAERTDIESLVTRTAVIGTRWHSIEERNERAISATYYLDSQQPEGLPKETAKALYAEYEWHWRRVDDLIAPTKGYTLSLFAGGGIPGVSTRSFGRLRARYAWWLPLDKDNDLNFRAEGGRRARRQPQRHSVEAPVSHRRQHDRARLRFRKPRRARRRCHRPRTLLRRGERRSHPLDQCVLGSRGIHRRGQCRRLAVEPALGARLRHRRARAHAARPVPPRRRLWPGRAEGAHSILRRAHVLTTPHGRSERDTPRHRPGSGTAQETAGVPPGRRPPPRRDRRCRTSLPRDSIRHRLRRPRSRRTERRRARDRRRHGFTAGHGAHPTRRVARTRHPRDSRRRRPRLESPCAVFPRHRGARTRCRAPDARNESRHG
jgi:translocation and assembly module TamA